MIQTAEPPEKRLLLLQAVTFLHPGTGQSTGVVDLPVQREVHTRFPIYQASGLKGALRDKAEGKWGSDCEKVTILFGGKAAASGQAPNAGALAFTDARILAFPVRSLHGVFFWVTCPMVIERLRRDLALLGLGERIEAIGEGPGEGRVRLHSGAGVEGELVLEEVALTPERDQKIDRLAQLIGNLLDGNSNSGFDPKRLALVGDEEFGYFVQYATQVSARIRLNERKTTTGGDGNLWYEETLPPETLLYALGLCHRARVAGQGNGGGDTEEGNGSAAWVAEQLEALLEDSFLQIGGNETVGQGWCRITSHDTIPPAEEAGNGQ